MTTQCESVGPGSLVTASITRMLPPTIVSIVQLADDDFQVRQKAEQSLLTSGIDAWDRLVKATRSTDAEIALAVRRIIHQIDYSDELCQYKPDLAGYRRASRLHRQRTILRLGQQANCDDRTVLALLTRFELDDELAELAAVELITCGREAGFEFAPLLATCSSRASHWLLIHERSIQNPQQFTRLWSEQLDLLCTETGSGLSLPHRRLLRWYAERQIRGGNQQQVDHVMVSIIADAKRDRCACIETFDWLLWNQQLDACQKLLDIVPASEQTLDARILFRKAELARLLGRPQMASKYAQQASEVTGQNDALQRIQTALQLQHSGLVHWAVQEWTSVAESSEFCESVRIQASCLAAEVHRQQADFSRAKVCLARALELRTQDLNCKVIVPSRPELQAQFHYLAHMDSVQKGDDRPAHQHLLNGLQFDPNHTGLLIAANNFARVSDSDNDVLAWRSTVKQLVDLALKERAHRIQSLEIAFSEDRRQTRLNVHELVGELNSFAWLASQTGRSLDEAEFYARKAVNLDPAASHLADTLAACLFSQSRIDEAIVYQQRAIRLAPWSQSARQELNRYRNARLILQMPRQFR